MMALPWVAWMSIEIDENTQWKVSLEGPHEQLSSTPHEGWLCSIKGKWIIKNLTAALWKHLNGPPILNHWAIKQPFNSRKEKDINWDMAEKTIQVLSNTKQQWVLKFMTKFLPYGKNMKKVKTENTSKVSMMLMP